MEIKDILSDGGYVKEGILESLTPEAIKELTKENEAKITEVRELLLPYMRAREKLAIRKAELRMGVNSGDPVIYKGTKGFVRVWYGRYGVRVDFAKLTKKNEESLRTTEVINYEDAFTKR